MIKENSIKQSTKLEVRSKNSNLQPHTSNLKDRRGITLIALIITIIILLILAVVSIKIAIGDGLIAKAEDATETYSVSDEKEKIQLGYSEYRMDKMSEESATLSVEGATVDGDETDGWTITFAASGNQYILSSDGTITGPTNSSSGTTVDKSEDLALVKKYFVGKTLKEVCNITGSKFYEQLDDTVTSFKDDADSITNASASLLKCADNSCANASYDIESETYIIYNYVKYNNALYKIRTEDDNNTSTDYTITDSDVTLAYVPSGNEGKTYEECGKTGTLKDWIILYDNGDSYELVSPTAMGSLTLGYNDEEAQTPGDVDGDGKENSDVDKAICSYNNAVTRINNYCVEQVQSLDDSISSSNIRSVGSNPDDPYTDTNEKYESDVIKAVNELYNGLGKVVDENFEQDYERMLYNGIADAGSDYWLASRSIVGTYKCLGFFVRAVYYEGGNPGKAGYRGFWWILTNGSSTGAEAQYGSGWNWGMGDGDFERVGLCAGTISVRPVVKISK